MCGIFGYVGSRTAEPILVEGLRTLEYRGYDSAGIYVPLHLFSYYVGVAKDLNVDRPRNLAKSVTVE